MLDKPVYDRPGIVFTVSKEGVTAEVVGVQGEGCKSVMDRMLSETGNVADGPMYHTEDMTAGQKGSEGLRG